MAAKVVVKMVDGKSRVTRCLSQYPLKFIIPTKVCSSEIDVVWVYAATYGGGIVTGDRISCELLVGDGCTAVFTTQASTKVYKSIEGQLSYQFLEAKVGSDGLLVVIPDPVTCFSRARYEQKQVFHLSSDANIVMVDWITSGRHERGEKWDFDYYRSTNQIVTNAAHPVLIDSVLLEPGPASSVAERMHHYQVIGMLILYGPKLKQIKLEIDAKVREMYKANSKPSLLVSCTRFGGDLGIVVRFGCVSTESVYNLLRKLLCGLESLVGVCPYR